MPSTVSHIPLPNRGPIRPSSVGVDPAFSAPVRWTLVVLSWVAFSVATYLAFFSISGSAVAGCGVGEGCDVVLSSSWSKWLGVPVAVLGLACYAVLASLSLLLGLRSETANRWITTGFTMLSIVAAGASAWFIGVQVFALGNYCKFCLTADTCGLLLGILAFAAAVKCMFGRGGVKRAQAFQPGISGMRATTAPAGTRPIAAPVAVTASPPSLLAAFGGAIPLLLLLIGGQLLFASKTYQVEKLALGDAIKLDTGANSGKDPSSPTGPTTIRPSLETEGDHPATGNDAEATASPEAKGGTAVGHVNDVDRLKADTLVPAVKHGDENSTKDAPPIVDDPAHERLVKFLGGKLTLDVYKHPIIGSPEAPHIVIEMVSYDCPHCRKMHATIEEALARYGDQVALLVMPVPLDKECNKLITDPTITHPSACGTARLAIALAKLNPSGFGKFQDFLMSGKDKPPDMGKIIPKAYGLANRDKLRDLSRSPEIAKQLDGYVDLFGQLQASSKGSKTFGLPVQILGDQVMSGEVESSEDVFKAWEEDLGVKPK